MNFILANLRDVTTRVVRTLLQLTFETESVFFCSFLLPTIFSVILSEMTISPYDCPFNDLSHGSL